jgi:hypothetical protein
MFKLVWFMGDDTEWYWLSIFCGGFERSAEQPMEQHVWRRQQIQRKKRRRGQVTNAPEKRTERTRYHREARGREFKPSHLDQAAAGGSFVKIGLLLPH